MDKNIKRFAGFTLAEVLMAKQEREVLCLHKYFRTSKPKEPLRNIKKHIAFTLAEVLITLAIIGVVAALTIPTLIKNYQQKQYETQLKKTYSTLSQAFQSAAANNENIAQSLDYDNDGEITTSDATDAMVDAAKPLSESSGEFKT